MSPNPQAIYSQRLQQREAEVHSLDAAHHRLAQVRLLLAGLSLGGCLLAPGPWLLLPLLLFTFLVARHTKLKSQLEASRRGAQFYRLGLARLDGSWPGQGVAGAHFLDPRHPYARDLDLFGKGSLFELLCRARTQAGQRRLADWLSRPASSQEIRLRQQAVRELKDRLDLREQLAGLQPGHQSLKGAYPGQWASPPRRLRSLAARLLASALGLAGLAALLYWFWSYDPRPLGVMILIQFAFRYTAGGQVPQILKETEPIRGECLILRAYLSRLEKESVSGPLLDSLWQPLKQEPSRALGRLESILDTLESRRNPLLAPLFALLLAPYQLAAALEDWREEYGPKLELWLDGLAQIEALLCFASFAWENPDYAWPELQPAGSGLRACDLGHPLLGPECVTNEVDLSNVKLWIVSGSNMSGKSSLLRSLGCNVILAMSGAPVRASRMQLEPLQVAGSIQLGDSLSAGISRFYAEILRLRQVLEQAQGPARLCYLLDEILGGTNSQDRLVGARAVVRRLFELDCLGLVTTHDLALTELAEELGDQAANVHFEDQLQEGVMSFDYHLRPGVIRRSNALELMRAVGLEV
ncbi:DNA mismatch repair protein MutS [bacterium]|nr:DNA mismatch repair protein MutS [bacterium]